MSTAVATTAGYDVLTVVAGVLLGAVVGAAGGFAAALRGSTRPGWGVAEAAAVPVGWTALLAVTFGARPGVWTTLTTVAAVTFVWFGHRVRTRLGEVLDRPSVQVLFVSGAPTGAITGRHVLPAVAAPLGRDLVAALSTGTFVSAIAGYVSAPTSATL